MSDPQDNLPKDDFFKQFVIYSIFVFGTLATVFYNFDWVVAQIQEWSASFIENGRGEPAQDHRLRRDVAIGLIIACLILSFGLFHLSRRLIHYSRIVKNGLVEGATAAVRVPDADLAAKEARIEKLERYLETQRQSMKKIYFQLYHDLNMRRHDFVRLEAVYRIDKDGNTSARETVTLVAENEPVHFWSFHIAGDNLSTPQDSIDDLMLQIECLDKGVGIEVVRFDDKPRFKAVVVWLLPELAPNTQRTLSISYVWNGLWRELIETGRTRFWLNHAGRSRHFGGDLSYTFEFDAEIGDVQCDITATKPHGIDLVSRVDAGIKTWLFKGDSVPIANTFYELTFRVPERQKITKAE